MNVPSASAIVPGLGLVAALTLAAFGLAALPGAGVLGPLVIALLLGLAWRRAAGLAPRSRPGARFAARTVLKVGVVLLGVRLDFGALAEVGWTIAVADVVVVALGLFLADRAGRAMKLSRGLRLSLGLGTSICGASAIVAGAPVTKAEEREVSVSIAVISVLGTLGVLGYALLARLVDTPPAVLGLMVGATLQEVGHVVAAGYGVGRETGDLATLVKLSRVALLAPVLLLIGLAGRVRAGGDGSALPRGARPPLLPWFLTGFLLLGALNSLGLLPPASLEPLYLASVLLTTAAMAGIGLQVDLDEFFAAGLPALAVGATAFAGLLLAMTAYGALAFG